jgi:hypothetical protein
VNTCRTGPKKHEPDELLELCWHGCRRWRSWCHVEQLVGVVGRDLIRGHQLAGRTWRPRHAHVGIRPASGMGADMGWAVLESTTRVPSSCPRSMFVCRARAWSRGQQGPGDSGGGQVVLRVAPMGDGGASGMRWGRTTEARAGPGTQDAGCDATGMGTEVRAAFPCLHDEGCHLVFLVRRTRGFPCVSRGFLVCRLAFLVRRMRWLIVWEEAHLPAHRHIADVVSHGGEGRGYTKQLSHEKIISFSFILVVGDNVKIRTLTFPEYRLLGTCEWEHGSCSHSRSVLLDSNSNNQHARIQLLIVFPPVIL